MLERFVSRGYGPELFLEFVPPSVRPRCLPHGVPLMSMAVVAELADALGGPVLEVSWPGRSALAGLLRAVRHADAMLAVSLPPSRPGQADDRGRVDEVIQLAAGVGYDRPLVLVARAPRLSSVDDGDIDRMAEWVYHEVDQGFTSVGFRPQDVTVDAIERVSAAAVSLVETGMGVELEFDPGPLVPLLLAGIEDEIPISAVRGIDDDVHLASGFMVVDPLEQAVPDDRATRVVVDGFIFKAIIRALSASEAAPLLTLASEVGVSGALGWAAGYLAELDPKLQEKVEALTYVNGLASVRMLGAEGTALELLDALAAEMFGT